VINWHTDSILCHFDHVSPIQRVNTITVGINQRTLVCVLSAGSLWRLNLKYVPNGRVIFIRQVTAQCQTSYKTMYRNVAYGGL